MRTLNFTSTPGYRAIVRRKGLTLVLFWPLERHNVIPAMHRRDMLSDSVIPPEDWEQVTAQIAATPGLKPLPHRITTPQARLFEACLGPQPPAATSGSLPSSWACGVPKLCRWS